MLLCLALPCLALSCLNLPCLLLPRLPLPAHPTAVAQKKMEVRKEKQLLKYRRTWGRYVTRPRHEKFTLSYDSGRAALGEARMREESAAEKGRQGFSLIRHLTKQGSTVEAVENTK